jgi:hypothetical protein
MSAVGLGDLRILLSQYFGTVGAVSLSGPQQAATNFGTFTATTSGNVSIFLALDTAGVHVSMADLTLDKVFRGVDDGRYIPPNQWQIFKAVVVAGHTYAFQVSAACSVALTVVYTPLAP